MENVKQEFEILLKQSTDYVDTRLELLKLQSVSKLSDVVSSLLSRMVVILVSLMFISLVSVAVSLWLGSLLGKSYYGFFIISGFYALIGLICFQMRHRLFKKPIGNLLIRKMLN